MHISSSSTNAQTTMIASEAFYDERNFSKVQRDFSLVIVSLKRLTLPFAVPCLVIALHCLLIKSAFIVSVIRHAAELALPSMGIDPSSPEIDMECEIQQA
jgi:hypothetical protein